MPFNAKAGRFGDAADAYEHFMKLHAIMRDGVGVPENGAQDTVGPWLTFDPKTERFTGEFAAEANKLVKDPVETISSCTRCHQHLLYSRRGSGGSPERITAFLAI